jgi:hypothetical protein
VGQRAAAGSGGMEDICAAAAGAHFSNLCPRDRCYDFYKIFAEKFGEKIGVFLKQKVILQKK